MKKIITSYTKLIRFVLFSGITGLFPIKITNNLDLQEISDRESPNPENPGSDKGKSSNIGRTGTTTREKYAKLTLMVRFPGECLMKINLFFR